jgi:two-component sensor histidine kinase
VSVLKSIKRFVAASGSLQKIVGICIGAAAIIADISNIFVVIGSPGKNTVRENTVWYFVSISLFGIIAIVTIFWNSVISRWVQVIIIFLTAMLAALTTRGGELTSGFFMIFGLVLIFEYRFNKYPSWIGGISALVLYPIALAIGLRQDSTAFFLQTAVIMIMTVFFIVLYGAVLLRHELRHREDKELLETRVNERTAELEQALAQKSVMLREIHHRVKNNLQIITSILQLEADREESPLLRASRSKSIQRIYAMALVHETLYQTDELESLDLARYADKLIDDIRAGSSIDFGLEAKGPILVDLDFAVPFGLLLNELVTNARMHAFRDRLKGRVDIRIEAEGGLALIVADDGAGLSDDIRLEGAKTLGFMLVNALARQLGGEVALQRNPGTTWTIRFSPRS